MLNLYPLLSTNSASLTGRVISFSVFFVGKGHKGVFICGHIFRQIKVEIQFDFVVEGAAHAVDGDCRILFNFRKDRHVGAPHAERSRVRAVVLEGETERYSP